MAEQGLEAVVQPAENRWVSTRRTVTTVIPGARKANRMSPHIHTLPPLFLLKMNNWASARGSGSLTGLENCGLLPTSLACEVPIAEHAAKGPCDRNTMPHPCVIQPVSAGAGTAGTKTVLISAR